jgi:hypothetical protein
MSTPAAILTAQQLYACFVRKLCSVTDVAHMFGLSIADIMQLNPSIGFSQIVPGGQVLLLRINPAYVNKCFINFDLKPVAGSANLFNLSIGRDEYRDRNWFPPVPDFKQADRETTFGRFEYVDDTRWDKDGVRITGGWDKANIGVADVPQISGVPYGWGTEKQDGKIRFYKKAHDQLKGLFAAWEAARLMPLVLTWDGAYNPRYMRKAQHVRSKLSNHSWGTAFDINAKWNQLGDPPAKLTQKGCVLEMVEIANQYGFFWGGHFQGTRPDGMHFEVAKLLS